jgi:FHS family glucose/mannose:H+ symporter-like MFS transporter
VDRHRVLLPGGALAAIAAAFLLMGALVAAYGPLLEYLTRHYHVSLALAGSAISVHAAGALLGVLVSMRAMERIPGRFWVGGALVATAAGCAGIALAPIWPLFLASAFTLGVGFGALDLGLNQLVAHSDGPHRTAVLNALNAAFGLGAVAGPILVSTVGRGHVELLYTGFAVAALALSAAVGGIGGRLPVTLPEEAAGRRPMGPLVGMFVLAYVFYVGTEIGIGGWMPSHLEALGLGSLTAAALTSGFWLGLSGGRLLVAAIPARVPESRIVLIASGVAVLSLMAATVGALAPAAYLFTGLAMAPIWSTGIIWLAKLRPGDSRATSWLFPAAMVGGVLIPGGIGLVVGRFGIGWAPVVLAAAAAATFAAFALARQLAALHQAGSQREAGEHDRQHRQQAGRVDT